MGKTYCEGLDPLLRAALKALPPDFAIPCDKEHVDQIPDFEVFQALYLAQHSSLTKNPATSKFLESLRNAYGFVLDLHFPLYVNISRYKLESAGFVSGNDWLGYAFAPLLAHEIVHARGERRESLAHRAELRLALEFIRKDLLPSRGYDIEGLKLVIRRAESEEGHAKRFCPKCC